jgi:adenine-specific DNA-methyltransferase
MHVDHVRDGRSAEDILYEILLKSGYPLTTPVGTTQVEGKTVFNVADGLLLVCLDGELSLELIRAIAEERPERVVCLDEGFTGNDQLKTNAAQLFRNKDIVFRTI